MKPKSLVINIFILLAVIVLASFLFSSCKKTSTTCSPTGTLLNIGSSAGGGYSETVSSGYLIGFSNTTLNFQVIQPGSPDGVLTDVGPQSCLSFSDSVTGAAVSVLYAAGHGYVGKFQDGHIVKFIAGDFNGGIVTVNYLFQ